MKYFLAKPYAIKVKIKTPNVDEVPFIGRNSHSAIEEMEIALFHGKR